jgi:hypothetical protein
MFDIPSNSDTPLAPDMEGVYPQDQRRLDDQTIQNQVPFIECPYKYGGIVRSA